MIILDYLINFIRNFYNFLCGYVIANKYWFLLTIIVFFIIKYFVNTYIFCLPKYEPGSDFYGSFRGEPGEAWNYRINPYDDMDSEDGISAKRANLALNDDIILPCKIMAVLLVLDIIALIVMLVMEKRMDAELSKRIIGKTAMFMGVPAIILRYILGKIVIMRYLVVKNNVPIKLIDGEVIYIIQKKVQEKGIDYNVRQLKIRFTLDGTNFYIHSDTKDFYRWHKCPKVNQKVKMYVCPLLMDIYSEYEMKYGRYLLYETDFYLLLFLVAMLVIL